MSDTSGQAPSSNEAQALFAEDTGDLRAETRNLLVALLQGPFIDERRTQTLWRTLLRDENAIRSRLSELYLQLVLDRDAGVAFVRQVPTERPDMPTVLRRQPLSFLESVLLLHLRERLTYADAQGDRAVVAEKDVLEHLQAYEGVDATADRTRFPKHCKAAFEKVKSYRLVHALKGSEDRYEVSPTLKLLFSGEQVEQLTRVYAERLAQARGAPGSASRPRAELDAAIAANDAELAAEDATDKASGDDAELSGGEGQDVR